LVDHFTGAGGGEDCTAARVPIVVPDVGGGGGGSVAWLISFRSPRGAPAWPARLHMHLYIHGSDKLADQDVNIMEGISSTQLVQIAVDETN
jgi:hypothetical protein